VRGVISFAKSIGDTMTDRSSFRNAKPLLAVILFACTAFAQQATTVTYSYGGLPLFIPSDAANVITLANIVVPQAIRMNKVTARVQIAYPNTGDLKIYLFSPSLSRTILLEHDCGIANVDTTFDDAAPSSWKDFCPVEAGRGPFRPDQPLSNFNGDDSSFGTWRLSVENDTSDSRTGWITGFSLTISGTTLPNPATRAEIMVNTASAGGSGTVAPGELVSILGVGLGPLPGVSAPRGALPTSLGGVSVTFDGVAVPIAYASSFRLDVQAPFNLVPGKSVSIQIANSTSGSTLTSTAAAVPVTDVVPGTYTNGLGGSGAATAVNPDGTTNGLLNPAAKGGFIVVYASGLGAVSPPVAAGAVPPISPLSNVTGTVTAYIGGVSAPVLYAGTAPGYPGLYQVNLTVPNGAGSGTQELLIYVNGKSAQSGTTVQIK
jgi:uncharacterized protein (TIGR03437 family)